MAAPQVVCEGEAGRRGEKGRAAFGAAGGGGKAAFGCPRSILPKNIEFLSELLDFHDRHIVYVVYKGV